MRSQERLHIITVFACVFVSAFANASDCSDIFSSNIYVAEKEYRTRVTTEVVSKLHLSAGVTKDLIWGLRFPKIEYRHARPIDPSEVTEILNQFRVYLGDKLELANRLPENERRVLEEAVTAGHLEIDNFTRDFKQSKPTSLVLNELYGISNRIKGTGFESLVHVLLLRLGFQNISSRIRSSQIRSNLHGPKVTQIRAIEFDFYFEYSGAKFVIEAKNIKPIDNPYMQNAMKELGSQLKRQRAVLQLWPEDVRPVHLMLTFFDLDAHPDFTSLRSLVDGVVYLRRKFLDEAEAYP